ncbi:hypothetical protein [Clostridium sporogenes]|uniref:hypothetical protein n=1 Tax=Clostridium sporogenes TaxID=1509 RepID=UPI0013C66230|nr:hypothetical protein [Clostridium sporogenes]NFQ34313.1 hypothetical protein [Clostridium sporogenes]NFQ60076.1 hypothetical protein [Clostridium sporogenes]NFU10764.1 hypothetical protein [Clostridium sporogenes]NFU43153.1 hypothetical protein [Clostridium sporogenes]NFU62309.1 hypothetical protein [Clostridium sporogenes]
MAGEIYIADKPTLDLTKANTDIIKNDTSIIKTDVKEIKSNFPLTINTDANYKFFHKFNIPFDIIPANSQKVTFEINQSGYVNAIYFKPVSRGKLYASIYIDDELIYKTGLYTTGSSFYGIFDLPSVSRYSDSYKYGTLPISVQTDYTIVGINPKTPSNYSDYYTTFIPEKLYFNNFKVVIENTDTANGGYEQELNFIGAKLNI